MKKISGGKRLTTVTVGQRVYWHDPGDGLASGPGVVVSVQHDPVEDDSVIALKMDDEGEAEVLIVELTALPSDNGRKL